MSRGSASPRTAKAAPKVNENGDLTHLFDTEAEGLILGAILRVGDLALEQVSGLTADDFAVESNRIIFRAILALHGEVHLGLDSIAHHLEEQGKLQAAGGLLTLVDLDRDCIPDLNLTRFGNRLRAKSRGREAVKRAAKLTLLLEGEAGIDSEDTRVVLAELNALSEGSSNLDGTSTSGIVLPEVRTGYDLYDSTAPDLRPLVRVKASGEALLMDGLSIFAARQKAGKSWEALQLAIAVAGGPEHEGLEVIEHGQVLYIALEEPEVRTRARIRKLSSPGDWLKRLAFVYQLLPLMNGGAEQLRKLVRQCEPRLVVIDTLTALVKAGGSKNSDVFRSQYSEVTCLRQMAEEFRAAFFLIHHLRKALAGDPVEAVAGTGGITAGCDSILVLKRKPEGRAELEITGREIAERTYALEFRSELPFGWRFIGDGAELATSEEQREVLALLKEEGGLTPVQIATELGKPRGGVRMMLRRMAADGKIEKAGKQYRHSSLSMSYRGDSEKEMG